ncbi:hypothetical protein DE146DRAFT_647853 [Phaeosphaeria sp. MPI-PUGE-AT-0046c]|nr:hypothetical protein DE146DRAFT_647853 [Phaeosphaeria sp. MPI-PUGE-AT-0046c]
MPHAPSPARASSTSTLTPGPVYTFRWICPNPRCHSCPARTRKYEHTSRLPTAYFDDYEDLQQLTQEMELEELEAKGLAQCDGLCKARQVYKSRDAKAQWTVTGKDECSYVGSARCMECGRVAGRSACLVEMDRAGEDESMEPELSLEQYIL